MRCRHTLPIAFRQLLIGFRHLILAFRLKREKQSLFTYSVSPLAFGVSTEKCVVGIIYP